MTLWLAMVKPYAIKRVSPVITKLSQGFETLEGVRNGMYLLASTNQRFYDYKVRLLNQYPDLYETKQSSASSTMSH